MTKRQLVAAMKKLDKAAEAIEFLSENGFLDDEGVLFSDIVSLKDKVETEISERGELT